MPNPRKEFARLYDKYIEKIYRFIFLKVESQEVAEDLTHQVFAKIWERFRTSNGTSNKIKNPTAYLYQIARNEVVNHHREKSKFQIISAEATQIADPAPTLEEHQQLQSDLESLRRCLGQLKDDYQNVIIWRYLDGLSIKNIAQIIDKPEGTVRVMIHRALKELREKMESS